MSRDGSGVLLCTVVICPVYDLGTGRYPPSPTRSDRQSLQRACHTTRGLWCLYAVSRVAMKTLHGAVTASLGSAALLLLITLLLGLQHTECFRPQVRISTTCAPSVPTAASTCYSKRSHRSGSKTERHSVCQMQMAQSGGGERDTGDSVLGGGTSADVKLNKGAVHYYSGRRHCDATDRPVYQTRRFPPAYESNSNHYCTRASICRDPPQSCSRT